MQRIEAIITRPKPMNQNIVINGVQYKGRLKYENGLHIIRPVAK